MTAPSKQSLTSLLILGTLFFIFGFVTWVNGTLIIYLKIACQLSDAQSYLVASAFYLSYFFTALPSSWILKKTGLKKGMMFGLFVMSVGALIFIPAASMRIYWIFLVGLFVIGTGLSILQTAVNPYVTIVGPIESAAKRISIMGICNKLAGILASFVMGAIVLSDSDTLIKEISLLDEIQKNIRLDELAARVILPYSLMAIVLAGLGFMVRYSALPEIDGEESGETSSSAKGDTGSVFQHPHLMLGVIALFLYVGVEVMAAETIGIYGQSQGISLSESKNFTSYTLFAMFIGYLIGIAAIPKLLSQPKALTISAITGVVFSILAIFTSGYTSVLCIALLGLANALMWPTIWPLAIEGLGKHTSTGSALLIMAIIGGGILSPLYGIMSANPAIGHHSAYWIMVPCYLFILFYGVKGYKFRKTT